MRILEISFAFVCGLLASQVVTGIYRDVTEPAESNVTATVETTVVGSTSCEYNGEAWICSDGLAWLADELNSPVAEAAPGEITTDHDAASCTHTADGWVCITDIVTEAR